jgi:hypothetical protein
MKCQSQTTSKPDEMSNYKSSSSGFFSFSFFFAVAIPEGVVKPDEMSNYKSSSGKKYLITRKTSSSV